MVSEIDAADDVPTVPETCGDPDAPDDGQQCEADTEDDWDEPGYGYGV